MITFIDHKFEPTLIRDRETLLELTQNYHLSKFQHIYKNDEKELLYVRLIPRVFGEKKFLKRFIIPLHNKTGLHRRVIFDVNSEAFPLNLIVLLKKFFEDLGSRFMFIDSGVDFKKTDYLTNYIPSLIVHEKSNVLPIKERTIKFSALCRDIFNREYRILMIYELYVRGIIDEGIVSCAPGTKETDLNDIKRNLYKINTIDRDFINLLPIKINDIYDDPGLDGTSTYNHINYPGANSIISLVIESSYEHFNSKKHKGLKYWKYWSRPIITEKTTKTINCKQLPIYMAPKGYVQHLREFGFDVFDDIIDHSYDNCDDPEERIILIANELTRLISDKSIEEIKNNETLNSRFLKNEHTLRIVYYTYQMVFKKNLTSFLNFNTKK